MADPHLPLLSLSTPLHTLSLSSHLSLPAPIRPEFPPEDTETEPGSPAPVVPAGAHSRCSRKCSLVVNGMGGEGLPAPHSSPDATPLRPARRLDPGSGLSPGRPPAAARPCPPPAPHALPPAAPPLPHSSPAVPAPRPACAQPGRTPLRLRARPLGRPAMKAAQAAGEEAPQGARSVKVVLVGDGGCGKTSLLMAFAEEDFSEVSPGPWPRPRTGCRESRLCGSCPGCVPTPASRGLPAQCGVQRGSHAAFGRAGLASMIPSGRMASAWEGVTGHPGG